MSNQNNHSDNVGTEQPVEWSHINRPSRLVCRAEFNRLRIDDEAHNHPRHRREKWNTRQQQKRGPEVVFLVTYPDGECDYQQEPDVSSNDERLGDIDSDGRCWQNVGCVVR